MNKEQYLIKKGRVANPVNGTLWIVKSTRSSVNLYEAPVWEITQNMGVTTWYDKEGNVTRTATSKRYKLNDIEPFEIDIYEDTNTGEEHGYGTGFGDLWGWSYFATPDKEKAQKLYEDEKLRVQTKYLLIF